MAVLTGAGISTDSGIPDFRGPNGVWTKNPKAERMAHISHYMDDPEVRQRSWQQRLDHPAWKAQPNAGHRALVDLERRGKLHTLITQNVDGMHQAAGSDPALVVEVHGTVHEVMCMSCDDRAPMERALGPGAGRRGRPAVPVLRRHPQVGHGLVRPEPRPARHRAGRAGRARVRPPARASVRR